VWIVDKRIIMLVEDNAADAVLIERALEKGGIGNPVFRAKDGLDALQYLLGTGKYEDRDTEAAPAVVLIDLNLPRMDGLELLRRMRADYRTKLVPVVIFTGSNDEQDLINGYTLGANSYVRKPTDSEQFARTVERLVNYWISLNEPAPPSERIWAHHFDTTASSQL
jgi:two-component system response regulator